MSRMLSISNLPPRRVLVIAAGLSASFLLYTWLSRLSPLARFWLMRKMRWLFRKRKAPLRSNGSAYASTATLIRSITGEFIWFEIDKTFLIKLKLIPGYESLVSALAGLEKILHGLESSRFQSDRDRDRYDLIYSVLARLRGVIADLQKFERNDFEAPQAAEEIGWCAFYAYKHAAHINFQRVHCGMRRRRQNPARFPFFRTTRLCRHTMSL